MEDFSLMVSTSIKEVMANPKHYIIPENLDAIEYLWNMNILTTQTNDYENEDSWIAIGRLSKENENIFYQMRNDDKFIDPSVPGILIHHGRGFRVPVKPGKKNTLEDFLPIFKMFKLQDVQKDGYMTVDEFFGKYTDCWKVIPNPYLEMEPKVEDFENLDDYLNASFEFNSMGYPRTNVVKVFDQSKAIKSIEEYIDDAGFSGCYDSEEGKIYYNKRLYEGHMKYKNSTLYNNQDNIYKTK